jgi:hypothetical protein
MPEFRRVHHRTVAEILRRLNAELLVEAECYFGGGTQIALELNEFRESRDIDFLCSSRKGFRMLRETVTPNSLGALVREPLHFAREVRADRDGIRTFVDINSVRIKFEMVLEARIDLAGFMNAALGVPVLDVDHMVAEKFLANADRGQDESVHARDLIDLAFLAAAHGKHAMQPGFAIATGAYGDVIATQLTASIKAFGSSRVMADRHINALGITDKATLRKGLRVLASITSATSHSVRQS